MNHPYQYNMLIISIDIGIKNFAYVILETFEGNINVLEWNILKLCDDETNASKVDLICVGEGIREKCFPLIEKYTFDKIVIENQIGPNAIRMKMIQGMVSMFFVMNEYSSDNIVNYNAVNKLKHYQEGKKKTTYQERKKLSKKVCETLVKTVFLDYEEVYSKSKKKDDLADCLLQGIDYVHKQKEIDENIFSIVKSEM